MEGEVSNGYILLRTFGALAAVIGLIYGLSWFVRKYLKPERWAPSSSAEIKVVQTFSISPKKKLMIVEVENQRLLLGVCDSSISCLKTLESQRGEVRHATV